MTLRKSILAIAVGTLLFAAPPAGAAVPKDFFGLVAEDVFTGDAAYRDASLAQQSSIGIGLIRQTFHWKQIETSPGHYDFSFYDAYVAATASHGIRVLPILFDPPPFRARTSTTRSVTYPPRHFADLGTFGAQVARRYGPNGSFWQQNPGVPKVPVTAYQIWNEPNITPYWPTGQSAKGYARLLKAAAHGIHSVDPRAEIVTAGLPDSHLSKPKNVFAYLKAMLHAGAKRSFDTLAVNPYGRTTKQLTGKLKRFRAILNRAHDRRARIWVTEFGWSDRGPRSEFRVGVAGQARRIRSTIPALVKARSKLRLRGVVYYDWRDAAPYPPLFRDFWGLHTGLLHRNGSAKPALASFKAAISAAR